MFIGLNLKCTNDFFRNYGKNKKNNYGTEKDKIYKEINKYVGENNKIDGTQILNDWFPDLRSDVFISHSHNDLDLAIGLGKWLEDEFGLNVFIDSYVWGSADKLLEKIDKRYCYQDETGTYNYHKRNFSTSHVHAMLSTALMNVIDKSECVIFLNTENSIDYSDSIINNNTNSPWIYTELIISKLIRKKKHSDYRPNGYLQKYENLNESLQILYRVDLEDFIDITQEELLKWKFESSKPLDDLYKIIVSKLVLLNE